MISDQGPLFIYGAGGHAKVVADALGENESVAGFIDDNANAPKIFLDRPVLTFDDVPIGAQVHVAIGDSMVRERLSKTVQRRGSSLATIKHRRAIVSDGCAVGEGSFIAAGAIAGPSSSLGQGSILNHGCVVDHDCTIGDWCHIAPNATLGGGVLIGNHTLIGANASILPLCQISTNCRIGAGAVVTHSLSKPGAYVGVPARALKSADEQ